MTVLTLVRHGQTDWNAARRIQGRTDIPLNEIGRAQARAAGRLMAGRTFDVVASSPLVRAVETARLIAASALGREVDPVLVPGIEERSYGDVEGMTAVELRSCYPDGIEFSEIPGLESRAEVVARATRALISLVSEHPGASSILIATHGAVIGSILRDLTADELPPLGVTVGNGSAHDVRVAEGALSLVAFDGSGDVVIDVAELSDGIGR